jgi:hypothetical protein
VRNARESERSESQPEAGCKMESLAKSQSMRRLMRDIEEMDRNPLENVCAQPNESDIHYWHGNCMCASIEILSSVFRVSQCSSWLRSAWWDSDTFRNDLSRDISGETTASHSDVDDSASERVSELRRRGRLQDLSGHAGH